MNYLFFDIECATCRGGKGKICEFGYLLTDDNFNEIKREEILINPNSPFDWYTLKNLLHFLSISVTIFAWIMGAELYAIFCVQSCPYPNISL